VMLLTIVSAGLVRMRLRLNEALRHIAIWAGVIAVLVLGYSFRGELGGVLMRVRAEFAPGYPAPAGANEVVVTQDTDGGYYLIGQVNGQPVRFLADTGASDIVLSPQDAQRLGVDVASLRFTSPSQTANGIGHGAGYTASSLAVGPIRLTEVPMQINQAPMSSSLLGMAFFRRLESFQLKDGKLYLRWRG
jgi:aspartyl protease family protein